MRDLQWIATGAVLALALVLMSEEPWASEGKDLPGDEWKREPEQGAQPDHAPAPVPPIWRRLTAGKVTQHCPKCGSRNLRFDNALGFWCRSCDEGFTAPMSLEMAAHCYAGFFDVRRAA